MNTRSGKLVQSKKKTTIPHDTLSSPSPVLSNNISKYIHVTCTQQHENYIKNINELDNKIQNKRKKSCNKETNIVHITNHNNMDSNHIENHSAEESISTLKNYKEPSVTKKRKYSKREGHTKYDSEIINFIIYRGKKHGNETLAQLMQQIKSNFSDQKIPADITVRRILKNANLSKKQRKQEHVATNTKKTAKNVTIPIAVNNHNNDACNNKNISPHHVYLTHSMLVNNYSYSKSYII